MTTRVDASKVKKVALVGFADGDADGLSAVLPNAIVSGYGAVLEAARTLVDTTRKSETGGLAADSGEGSVLLLATGTGSDEVAKALRLSPLGVSVVESAAPFEESRSEEDLSSWLTSGAWPAPPAAAPAASDPLEDLFGGGDDDLLSESEWDAMLPPPRDAGLDIEDDEPGEDDDEDVPTPAPAPSSPAAPLDDSEWDDDFDLPPVAPTPARAAVAAPAPVDDDLLDELPSSPPRRPVPAPAPDDLDDFDVLDVAPAEPTRRLAAPVLDDEDDDLPLPPRRPASAPAPVVEPAPAPVVAALDEDDEDDLPLPPRTPARRPVAADVEDELPPLPPATRPSARPAPAPAPPVDEDDDEEDLALPPRRPLREAPRALVADEDDEDDLALPERPAARRPVTAPAPERTDSLDELRPLRGPRRPTADPLDELPSEPVRAPEPVGLLDTDDLPAAPAPRPLRGPRRPTVEDPSDDPVDERPSRAPLRPGRRPLPAPEPEPEDDVEDGAFEAPSEDPPFVRRLTPEQQRSQGAVTEITREFGSGVGYRPRGRDEAVVTYVSGTHGGAGKTTLSYLLANTTARALAKSGSDAKVWLIEADYRNSKLAHRLDIPAGRDSGTYAQFLERLHQDRSNLLGADLMKLHDDVVQKCVHVNESSGLNVVVCPYDSTTRKQQFVQLAIQRIVEYAKSQGGYVFVDADTITNDDILDRALAGSADHVVIVTDVGHLADFRKSAKMLTTTTSSNGVGVDKQRISVFFNRTSREAYESRRGDIHPYPVDGYLPRVDELESESYGWVGDVPPGPEFSKMVVQVAQYMNVVEPMDALLSWERRRPTSRSSAAGGGGLLGRLLRRGR